MKVLLLLFFLLIVGAFFLDGVAVAAAFLVEPRLGIFVAIATFLHEVPQEIGDFGVLLHAGWGKPRIITFNLMTG